MNDVPENRQPLQKHKFRAALNRFFLWMMKKFDPYNGKTDAGTLGYQVTSCTSSLESLEVFRDSPDKFDLSGSLPG